MQQSVQQTLAYPPPEGSQQGDEQVLLLFQVLLNLLQGTLTGHKLAGHTRERCLKA